MKKIILILAIIGYVKCFGQQHESKNTENDIAAILNKYNSDENMEPVTFLNGVLTKTTVFLMLDLKESIFQTSIEMKNVSDIQVDYFEKTKITRLTFISDFEKKGVKQRYARTGEYITKRSEHLTLRHIKSETLVEVLEFFNTYMY